MTTPARREPAPYLSAVPTDNGELANEIERWAEFRSRWDAPPTRRWIEDLAEHLGSTIIGPLAVALEQASPSPIGRDRESLHDFQARMQTDLAAKNQASPPPPGAGWSLAYHADGARWPEQDMLTTMPVAPVQAERDLLAAQVAAVRALHTRHTSSLLGHDDAYCGACSEERFGCAVAAPWPCDTIRALDTAAQDQQP